MPDAKWQFSLYTLFQVMTVCACMLGIGCAIGVQGLFEISAVLIVMLVVPATAFACVCCYAKGLAVIVDFVLRPFFLR